ncbi:hypothetical protein KC887_02300 [Candidatus Kaiserbacteria bacterium]|nr:hypothetical protein [Candidatus Kaiserbacteria bacterium]
MFGNSTTAQDIANVIRQGQREGFVAGVAVAAGTYVFARLANHSAREYWATRKNNKQNRRV